jgi:O-antigen/teichoic acid export membrane protein
MKNFPPADNQPAPTDPPVVSQFFSGTLSIGAARASTIALGLVSMIIAVRNLSVDDYGAYVLLIVILTFLTEFTSFGMTLSIPKYLASSQDQDYKQVLQATVLYFRLFVAAVVGVLIFLSRPLLLGWLGASPLLDLLAYLPLLFGLSSLSHLFNAILRGRFDFAWMGGIEFVTDVVELLALALAILVFHMGVAGLIYAKIISTGLYVIMGYWRSRFHHTGEMNLPVLKELLRFGFPLQMQYLLDFSFNRMDTMIVGSFLGTSGIAYYEIARKIPDSLMQTYPVFISVYFPISANLYAGHGKEKTERLMNTSLRILAFLIVLGALVSVVFGRDIIRLLFSETYLPSYTAFVILMVGLVLKVTENTLGYSLVAIGDSDKPLIVNAARSVISLVGNVILLPLAGFVSAALVSVGSNLIAIPLDVFFLMRRKLRPNFMEVFKPLVVLAVFSLLFFVFGASSLLLKWMLLFLYLPACLLWSIVTRRDFSIVLKEAQRVVARIFKREPLSAGSKQV